MAKIQWKPTEDKLIDPEEIKRLRDVLRGQAAEDLAKGRRSAIVRWAVIDVALSAPHCFFSRLDRLSASLANRLTLLKASHLVFGHGGFPQLRARRSF
jgi:hypothetical protein